MMAAADWPLASNIADGFVTVTGSGHAGRIQTFVPDYTLAAVAPRHCSMAAARKGFRVLREMRWRSMLKVLWTAAWADRKRRADLGDLKRCILRSRRRVG